MVGKGIVGALLAGLVLSGCALGGLMGANSAPVTYDLQAPDVARSSGGRGPQISIATPIAVRTIDTDEILVRTEDGRLSYFPGSAWGDRLPKLFQARLVKVFADSGAFRAVVTNQDRISGDISLTVEIRDFQINVSQGRAEAVVDVYVKLVDERNGVVIGTNRFSGQAPAHKDDAGAGVRALNSVFQKVAVDILSWTSRKRGQV